LIGLVKVADNSLDYSLGNTTRQVLWLPTSREAKYKAKQAVDSFFVRAGDVASAALVFAGERLAFTVPAFSAVTVVLTSAWLGVVFALTSVRTHRVARLADQKRPAESA
jgi:AAA family ATP:ADP antiporter